MAGLKLCVALTALAAMVALSVRAAEARLPQRSVASATCPNPPLQNVDLEAYTGVWYEIGSTALFKSQTEQDLICSTARYSLIPSGPLKGKVRVLNSGYNESSAQQFSVTGYADVIRPGRLAVNLGFGPPGDYRIIYIAGAAASKYDAAIVYSCDTMFGFSQGLFVISRTPQLPHYLTLKQLLSFADGAGIHLEPHNEFIMTIQDPKTCGRLFFF